VVDAFWVDVYLNPYPPLTGASQRWYDVADQGIVWEVDGVPVQPGDTLTLTIGDRYYSDPDSDFSLPLPASVPVYAQVDPGGSAGEVWESHEMAGSDYNNITGSTVSP
jgi:hypothetical protein